MTPTALRPVALVMATGMASLLALFLDWRGRFVRRLIAGGDGEDRAPAPGSPLPGAPATSASRPSRQKGGLQQACTSTS